MENNLKIIPFQLDFFEDATETRINNLDAEIQKIGKSADKVRRGLFAKQSELMKKMLELENRLEILEKFICQSQKKQ